MEFDGSFLNGIIWEITTLSEKSFDGRWIIPITVDWDFTITKSSHWESGEMDINEDAIDVMRKWVDSFNVGWILDTMRNDEIIDIPLKILEERDVKLYGIRKNPCQEDNEVSKIFSVLSIDDKNIGTPLIMDKNYSRPYVDWKTVDELTTPKLEYIYSRINL